MTVTELVALFVSAASINSALLPSRRSSSQSPSLTLSLLLCCFLLKHSCFACVSSTLIALVTSIEMAAQVTPSKQVREVTFVASRGDASEIKSTC